VVIWRVTPDVMPGMGLHRAPPHLYAHFWLTPAT
jgi:hypothetical protein